MVAAEFTTEFQDVYSILSSCDNIKSSSDQREISVGWGTTLTFTANEAGNPQLDGYVYYSGWKGYTRCALIVASVTNKVSFSAS